MEENQPVQLRRDARDYPHYRPSRAGTRGVIAYVTPAEHAALAAYAKAHNMSLGEVSLDALRAYMQAQGVAVETDRAQTA